MKNLEDIDIGGGYGALGMFFAFFGGALAGAGVALLLTPRTGEETRMKLRQLASTARDRVSRAPRRLREAGEAAKEGFAAAYESSRGEDTTTRH